MIAKPKYKIARRLGDSIFSKTQTPRYAMVESKKRASLAKRRKHRSTVTEYGLQFLEKQKIRLSYGITEGQLARYVSKTHGSGKGEPVARLFRALESRLDNTLFRLGLAKTRSLGRQLVAHGHILVNGKKVKSPSYAVRIGDRISLRQRTLAGGVARGLADLLKEYNPPAWLSVDPQKLEGVAVGMPSPGDYETNLNFGLVMQFYSRV